MDLGINIADDLEELKNNLNKFKNSKEKNFLHLKYTSACQNSKFTKSLLYCTLVFCFWEESFCFCPRWAKNLLTWTFTSWTGLRTIGRWRPSSSTSPLSRWSSLPGLSSSGTIKLVLLQNVLLQLDLLHLEHLHIVSLPIFHHHLVSRHLVPLQLWSFPTLSPFTCSTSTQAQHLFTLSRTA